MRNLSILVAECERHIEDGRENEARRLLLERLSHTLVIDGFHDHRESGPWAVHYTTVDATIGILETGGFRMYNLETSNDPLEGQVLESAEFYRNVSQRHSWLTLCGESTGDDAYALSAIAPDKNGALDESLDDDLVWWRLYGHAGGGCSIRFNTDLKSFPMYRVHYPDPQNPGSESSDERVPGLQRLETALVVLDAALGRHIGESKELRDHISEVIRNTISNYAYLVKDGHYRAEHEVRALQVSPPNGSVEFDMAGGAPLRRFVDGPRLTDCLRSGSAITIGPSVQYPRMLRAFLERRLRENGCEFSEVRISKVRFRH